PYLVLLFRIRTRLNPTLFPYTTLFRSERNDDELDGRGTGDAARVARRGISARRALRRRFGPCAAGRVAGAAPPGARSRSMGSPPDRKSTRLNSSHLGISYAVFCLKKKK